MKENLKSKGRLLAALLCCMIVVVLTGCGMQTNLTINDEFAGERVIICDELSDTNLIFSSANVQSVTEVLQKKCPTAMEFKPNYTDGKKSKAIYTFTIKFNSKEDYAAKVGSLLGRTPNIEFSYQSPEEQLFKSGFSITEDFNSADLLAWAKDALKSELKINQDLSSMTDTVKITMNGTEYDNDNLMSSRIKLNTIAAYKLSNIEINTTRYGEDDYSREVIIYIPQKTMEVLGKENIGKFLQSVTDENASGQWLSDENKLSRYRISFGGSVEFIAQCTSKIFGDSSSFAYNKDESLYTAFSETGVLAENISFEKFPCESDGSCNAVLTYKNMDACTFDADKSTLSAGSKPVKGEGLSDDGSTIVLNYKKANSAKVELFSSTVYKLSEVDVVTNIKGDDQISQSIILASPIDTGAYGAEFAQAYFKKKFNGSDLSVAVGKFNDSGSQFALTIATPYDTAENVTALLQQYLGAGNMIEIKGENKFAVFNYRDVSVSVDLADMIKPSGYDGEIMYSFKGSGEAYDVDWTSANGGKDDVLMGVYRSGEFEHPIAPHAFTITYHVRRLNMLFVILITALIIVSGGGLLMGAAAVALKAKRKRDAAKLEAVQTMALVKLPDGTEQLMEIPPEEAANTVVMMPKHDDGLDDDDDEPENVWLFSTALRIFSVTAAVLFFLSFATISWTDLLTTNKSISGFDMAKGFKLLDYAMDGRYGNFVYLAVPLLMFAVLTLRKHLPKFACNMLCIALAAFQIWSLMGLPQIFEEQAYALGAQVGKRFTVDIGWAYNYSIMIYVILLFGFIVLTMIDTGVSLRRRSNKDVKGPKIKSKKSK